MLSHEKREKRFDTFLGTASLGFVNSVVAGRHSTVIKSVFPQQHYSHSQQHVSCVTTPVVVKSL